MAQDIQQYMEQLQPGDKLVMTFQKSQKPFWSATQTGADGGAGASAAPPMAPPMPPMGPSSIGPAGPPPMGPGPGLPDDREALMAAMSAGQ